MKKVFFAISSLGLGHTTRSLVIINYLLTKNCKITIMSYGNALNFIKKELFDNNQVDFIEFTDYPLLERGKGIMFYLYLFFDLIKTNFIIKRERNYIKSRETEFDIIFSDGRYGVYSKKIKSFLISHQIAFIMPKGLGFFKKLANKANYNYFKKFDSILIPDFEDIKNNIAGDLSHNYMLKKLKHIYIGVLSSCKEKNNIKKDIDYLFIISGYLKEHKDSFVEKLIIEAKKLNGKKVFILGDTSKKTIEYQKKFDITIYSYVSGVERNKLFEQANIIISRSGYTTIMDLVKLNKKAILFPTPNQTEQEYLATYLEKKGYFVVGDQEKNIDLKKLVKKIESTKKINVGNQKFEKIIDLLLKNS